MRILVVDDEKLLVKGMKFNLENEGYEVDCAYDGAAAVELARNGRFDLIILDVMMPELDGLEACMRIREFSNVPIIMLTAKSEDADKLMGFESGADDYLTKPFAFEELSARIRSMLRRHTPSRSPILQVGQLEMDTVHHTVHRDGRAVQPTTKEYALLEYMMRNAGQVLTAGQIYDHVWDYKGSLDSNLVPVYIGYLRNKLDKGETIRYIQTVRGFGYVLREEKDEA